MGMWVADGLVTYANDGVTAGLINDTGTETHTALTAIVTPLAEAALTSSPTFVAAGVAAAAAAAPPAVAAAIVAQDLVHGYDPRIPQFGVIPGVSAVIRDPNLFPTFMEADDVDGSPTPGATKKIGTKLGLNIVARPGIAIGVADVNRYPTFLEARDTDGSPTDGAAAKIALRVGPLLSISLATKTPRRVSGMGSSSITRQMSSSQGNFAQFLPPDQPLTTVGANGGWKLEQQEAALGSNPAVSNATFTMPGTGDVTFPTAFPYYDGVLIEGTLDGTSITAALKSVTGGSTYILTRRTAGSAVSIPSGTKFIPSRLTYELDDLGMFNLGKNDIPGGDSTIIMTKYLRAWNYWRGSKIVIGHYANADYTVGTSARTVLDAVNAATKTMATAKYYFDTQAALASDQFWALLAAGATGYPGVAKNSAGDDNTAIAGGYMPPSANSGDGIHLSTLAYICINRMIRDWLITLGYTYYV